MARHRRRHPPGPARWREPGRLRRRLSRLCGAAHVVGTLRGIRRPDGRRPALGHSQGQGRARPARRSCGPRAVPGSRTHPARPPLAPGPAHPRRRDPRPDRSPVRRGRPGHRERDHRPSGVGRADRAGGSRPATGTVSMAVVPGVRVQGRGGWFFNHLAWAGPLRAGGQAELKAARRNARPPQRARVWPPALPPHARTPVKQPPAAPVLKPVPHNPAKPPQRPGEMVTDGIHARHAGSESAGRRDSRR